MNEILPLAGLVLGGSIGAAIGIYRAESDDLGFGLLFYGGSGAIAGGLIGTILGTIALVIT